MPCLGWRGEVVGVVVVIESVKGVEQIRPSRIKCVSQLEDQRTSDATFNVADMYTRYES